MAISRLLRLLIAMLLLGSGACRSRIVQQAKSPDGRFVALAVDDPEIDGPNQRLLIRRDRETQQLKRLAVDDEGCTAIVWREDGSQVGFVIIGLAGQYVRVYDPLSGHLIGRTDLTPQGMEVRNPVMTRDGRLTFDECNLGTGACTKRTVQLSGPT